MDDNKIKGFDFSKAVKYKSVDSKKSKKAISKEYDRQFRKYNVILPVKEAIDKKTIIKNYLDKDGWTINREITYTHYYAIFGSKLSTQLFKFSTSALKIIGYISTNLMYNSNRIDINTKKICETLNINTRSFYSAIFELDKHNVLYRTSKTGIFSINPLCLFRGNIKDFINDYHKKYGEEDIQFDDKGRIIISD